MNTTSRPLSRTEAAAFLTQNFFPVSAKSLATWAVGNESSSTKGPAFIKVMNKRVVYDKQTLIEWAQSKMSAPVTSTLQLKK